MYTPQFHKTDVTLCFICEKVGKGLCRALMVCRIANTDQHFNNFRLLLSMHFLRNEADSRQLLLLWFVWLHFISLVHFRYSTNYK